MKRRILSALAGLALCLAPVAQAGERQRLGYGRLWTNDNLVALRDRWQTASYASSRVWGPGWTGRLPDRAGALIEFRFGSQLMTPANIVAPAAGDRPFAGALSFGLHTHFQPKRTEVALGLDMVVTGPQTRLTELQTAAHDFVGIAPPSPAATRLQLGNAAYPTLVAELGETLRAGDLALRPFAELRWGAETLARAGVDVVLGPLGRGELWIRDPVTGHRYRTIRQEGTGFAVILGADIAHVADSVFLPAGHLRERTRLRAGLHRQGERLGLFYGVTWMSREFAAQPEGQMTGSVRIKYDF